MTPARPVIRWLIVHSMNTSMPIDDGPVLERPDHLQPGPVADVGQPRVGVAAERPLEDPPVPRPVEDGAPQLELADPIGRLHARGAGPSAGC